MVEEGQIVTVNGQRYLVVFVTYDGTLDNTFIKGMELRGIKE